MNNKKIKLLQSAFLLLVLISCNSNQSSENNRIVIGIPADVQTFNTLFAFSYEESAITDLLYPGLLDFRWNDGKGELEAYPMIAKSWQWSADSSSLKFILRDDIKWSDGKNLTTDDVVFSYDLFSDPEVKSRLAGTFNYMFVDSMGQIDIQKTFVIISQNEFDINFPEKSFIDLNKVSIPVIPKHIFVGLNRNEISTSTINFSPVSCGPFKLKKWKKNQSIILEADSNSFLFNTAQTSEIIFKIIPDYTSRILQLKKGDIDLVELIKVEDIEDFKSLSNLSIFNNVGREYDYIGWNNIDPEEFSSGKVKPNKLFGNKNVRRALTIAINRKEILSEYLLNKGTLASTPVSPIFKSFFDENLKPYEYNPDEAKTILAGEGWKDEDKNGILEKGKTEFRFTLYYPVGNPLREFASVVVKNNLKAIGIEVTLEKMEMGTFIDYLYERKLDSWMAGWGIPIPLELKPYWYSDPNIGVLNFACYGSSEADSVLNQLDSKIINEQKIILIKKFQTIIHQDEPVSFLYWTPNIIVYNHRIKNINITPYGVLAHCWEWILNE